MIDWNPESYHEHTRFVSDLGAPVVELLAPRTGERILDLGCGDGVLTRVLMDAGADVIGVDASRAMIAQARAAGVRAVVASGAALPVAGAFDAVFSNAALHWMPAADEVIQNVWRALRPGGRFVGEMGGAGNVQQIQLALHSALRDRGVDPAAVDPWYFPDSEEYSEKLRAVGFDVKYIELIPRPTPLPTGIQGWIESVAHPFLNAVATAQRGRFLEDVMHRLQPVLGSPQGAWTADYVRLRFHAARRAAP